MKYLPVILFQFVSIFSSGQKNSSSSDIEVVAKNAVIAGTLTIPEDVKKPPIVLIIAGSGPTDRNGNSKMLPGKNNSLLQFADSLEKHGIASLRYDKRGIGNSKMAPGITEDSILFTDMVDDAELLYVYLKHKGFKKIFIAGHSEGSLIGMALAKKVTAAGFISIAGSGRKAADILKEQLASLPESLKTESYNGLDSLQAGKKIKNVNPQLISIFRPSVQPYMISWFSYDPVKIIRELSCKILILQGNNDLQVKEKDAIALKQANQNANLIIINNMNHILKKVLSKERNENIASYSNPELPLMEEFVSAIILFIKNKK